MVLAQSPQEAGLGAIAFPQMEYQFTQLIILVTQSAYSHAIPAQAHFLELVQLPLEAGLGIFLFQQMVRQYTQLI